MCNKKSKFPLISITFSVAGLLLGTLVTDAYAARTTRRPWLAKERTVVREQSPAARAATRSLNRVTSREPRASHKGQQIARQAQRYKGVPYRFGGDSKSKGFDCSGLVRRIFNDLQLKKVPRTSSGLYSMGTPVRLNDLKPGDLVFFKNTYKRGISHVGVYAGDNRFIHAENRRRGVTFTSLAEPYYQLHYAGARRLY